MNLITHQKDLESFIADLINVEFIAVDTEFIREKTFWPHLCLIQIAAGNQTALIDPLSPSLNLAPVFELMRNTRIMKIFHAARQDIEILFHKGQCIPSPLFDTQVAAMVCGFGESIAFDKLVYALLDEKIDKSSRFTHWNQRPLSPNQLSYALSDVTYLLKIYPYLMDQLKTRNRLHWLSEEMQTLTAPQTYDINPQNAWKRLKIHTQTPREFALLCAVASWREKEAQKKNVPRGYIIKDYVIQEIIKQKPRKLSDLECLRCFSKEWQCSQRAADLLEVINQAFSIAEENISFTASKANPQKSFARIELLNLLLRIIAEKEEVAPKLIANAQDIEKLASEGEKAKILALSGWRFEMFGKKALKLLDRRIGFKLDKNDTLAFLEI